MNALHLFSVLVKKDEVGIVAINKIDLEQIEIARINL